MSPSFSMKTTHKRLLLLSTLFLVTTAQQCYFPNGDKSNDTPCSTTDTFSCCGKGSACLSNGLCMHTKHIGGVEPSGSWFGRGSCTDPTWGSDKCPKFCITKGTDPLDNGVGVNKCDAEGENEQYYWCADNATKGMESKEACSNEDTYFTIRGRKLSSPSHINTGGRDTDNGLADPTTLTIVGYTDFTPDPTAVATVPQNSTTAAATSPTATDANLSKSPPSKDYSVAIGAGVGVPLGIIAIGIIGYLFWRNRRNSKVRSYSQTLPPYQATDSNNEWMVMRNQPSPSIPGEQPKVVPYQYEHQTEASEVGERRNSVHQLPAAEHIEPQELSSGRSW